VGELKHHMQFSDTLITGELIEDQTKIVFSEGNGIRVYSINEDPFTPIEVISMFFKDDISSILDAGN
jgi:hypothetical protein